MPKQTHAGVVNPCASRDCKTTGVPGHHRVNPGCPESARRLEPFPHAVHQTPQLPELVDAFLPRILTAPPFAGAPGDSIRQRTVPELCTPWPAVRHAFTSSFCLLDTPCFDYSSKLDEPHAVYGILQLIRSSNTPTTTPNPDFSSKLPLSGDTTPCRALPAELDQPRGCRSSETPQRPPHDRSCAGVSPT